jgi:hypothetical protein
MANTLRLSIVFVHGLSGDPVRSWAANDVVWPRDLLPQDIPSARIMTFAYDGSPDSARYLAHQTLYNHADDLMAALHEARVSSQSEERPLIFVCHNLAGLLIKSLLVRAVNSKLDREDAQDIYRATCGVMFFGTPHQSSHTPIWARAVQRIVAMGQNSARLSESLLTELEWLELQLEPYKSVSSHISNVFYYELRPTLTASPPSLVWTILQE